MESETFPAMLQRLYREEYSGAIVIHFGKGKPQQVEIPCEPTRIRLAPIPRSGVVSQRDST